MKYEDLKFKALDEFNNLFVVSGINTFVGAIENQEDESLVMGKNIKELFQFTGFKDQYGEEIYEKDIVTDDENNKFLVVIHNGAYMLMDLDNGDFKYLLSNSTDFISLNGHYYSQINTKTRHDYELLNMNFGGR